MPSLTYLYIIDQTHEISVGGTAVVGVEVAVEAEDLIEIDVGVDSWAWGRRS